jgi:small subunit ribosomal protein S20
LANTKSAIKEIRVANARGIRNKSARSETKSVVRKAGQLISAPDKDAAVTGSRAAERALDRAARKGTLHPNAAARSKSRLAKKLNKATAAKT